MKGILFFLTGVSVGAVMALLMAPESGEELRGHLSDERQRLDEQAHEKLSVIQQRLDEMQADKIAEDGEVEVVEDEDPDLT